MSSKIFIFLMLMTLFSCIEGAYKPSDLRKLSPSEMLDRARLKDFPHQSDVVFRTENGVVVSADSLPDYTPDEWATDWYADTQGVVREMVFRKATAQDKELYKKIMEAVNYQPPIELLDVDCDQQAEILQQVFDSDQSMRNDEAEIDTEIDRLNLTMVISLIEKCGMPTLKQVSEIQMAAIWVAFQHGDNVNRKKYLPLLEKAAKNGDLKATQIALMKDRTLMMDGQPQVYGTQVRKSGKGWVLYDLASPETVNERRADVGLEPLQDYLNRWDIEFLVEQEQ